MNRFAKAFALFFVDLFSSMHMNLWWTFKWTYNEDRRAFSCGTYICLTVMLFGLFIEPKDYGIFRVIVPLGVLATSYFFFCYKQRYRKVLELVKSRKESGSYKLANVIGILLLISPLVIAYLLTFRIID
jgi:glucan phosphoethanolaminetransferase (alkaline phosphatase superfamily)